MKGFPRTFWVANAIELIERWAWYGFFMLFANYLTGSSDRGGLEFSQSQKGIIMGVGTGILYFLPVLTGAIADRYGYKRVMFLSFVIYASAFLLLPQFSSFTGVFLMYLYLALGAALFKPIVSATIARTVTSENASIGFGVFYMMVNIGGFVGPMVTLLFKDSYEWVFYVSAAMIGLNFLLLLFYKEPPLAPSAIGSQPARISLASSLFVLRDVRFMLFLLIVAGFWAMFYQIYFMLPVFITQWVDTGAVYDFFHHYLPFVSTHYSPSPGVMDAEFITNVDALSIILLQVVVSGVVMRMRPLRSMMAGFIVCTIGMSLSVMSQNVLFTVVAIVIFALGEMAASPKITEYIGRIAPHDRKAVYMGFSFVPVFLGSTLAGILSGPVYQQISDKAQLADRFLDTPVFQDFHIPEGLSANARFEAIAAHLHLTPDGLTSLLWADCRPWRIFLVIMAVGFVSATALYFYDRSLAEGQPSD
ncbi:MAG: MFS transporter [Tannerellaceae bacterium]|jgi:dipeptide/tripeptide permease|nr:MFS transporter [Tannerellaceae bacterium]